MKPEHWIVYRISENRAASPYLIWTTLPQRLFSFLEKEPDAYEYVEVEPGVLTREED